MNMNQSTDSSPSQTPPTVALVGRVNVGKSTLFNRILEEHRALTSDVPGTTRDRIERLTEWRNKQFKLVDSGGYISKPQSSLEQQMSEQTARALETADLIVFVVDAKAGRLPQDDALAEQIRKRDIPVVVCANKTEQEETRQSAHAEFAPFGFASITPTSSYTGVGVGDLLDEVTDRLEQLPNFKEPQNPLRLTFVGKPNVGKSSLINSMLNDERVIVTDLPHTTRESQDIHFSWRDSPVTLVDTAGIHPLKKIRRNTNLAFTGKLEARGIQQTESQIEQSDVIVFVVESHGSMSVQDYRIADLLTKNPEAGVIIVANKWDLIDVAQRDKKTKITQTLHKVLSMLPQPPVVFTSAKNGKGVEDIVPAALDVFQRMNTALPGEKLSAFRANFGEKNPIISKGKGALQRPVGPPELASLREVSIRPRVLLLSYRSKLNLPKRYTRHLLSEFKQTFNTSGFHVKLRLQRL